VKSDNIIMKKLNLNEKEDLREAQAVSSRLEFNIGNLFHLSQFTHVPLSV